MSKRKSASPDADAAAQRKQKRTKLTSDVEKAEKRARKKLRREERDAASSKSSSATAVAAADSPPPPPNPPIAVAPGAASGYAAYVQNPLLLDVSPATIASFYETQQIAVSDPASPDPAALLRPILQFAHLPHSDLVAKAPFAAFAAPTPIQSASWPFLLAGRDVIGIAETGSGKTLAFALPGIERLHARKRQDSGSGSGSGGGSGSRPNRNNHVRALVVSPTRELAMQTHQAMAALAASVGLSAVCLFGGASKDEQRAAVRRKGGADIVVATPGRLRDFVAEGSVDLSHVEFAVLDEADRMLDKGFEEDIKEILGQCAPKTARQTLMFTATWPRSIQGLAEGFMTSPVRITVGGRPDAHRGGGGANDAMNSEESNRTNGAHELQANKRIAQEVEVVDPRGKEQRLLQLVKAAQAGKAKNDRILVFCLYKKEAVRVHDFLERRGVHVVSIHGDLRQEQRTKSLEAFKTGATTVLVATDVAARGLDIPEVKLVINLTVSLSVARCAGRISPRRIC
jgi:ATP-dependent RNA helicase DBP3